MSRIPIAIVFGAFALGCAPEPEITVAELTMRLPSAPSCRPAEPPAVLTVEALGDFPASDARTIELVALAEGAADIERFPFDTRIVTVRARSGSWDAVGLRFVDGPRPSGALLLAPVDRSCPSPDPALALLGGDALALRDGGLALAGGREGELGSRRLSLLRPGEVLAEVLTGLDQRRVGHALVEVGDELWILGGALGAEGPAHDTFERFTPDGQRLAGGVLGSPRRDFGATVLADDRVLLVGGRETADGAPLATAELVSIEGDGRVLETPFARLDPHVVATDEGHVLVVGGVGVGGAVVLSPVFLFDPASAVFVPYELTLPRWSRFDAVPLPGGRVALVGDAREGLSPSVALLHVRDRGLGVVLEAETFEVPALTDALDVRAAPLPDGDLLVTGGRAAPFALQVSPSDGSARPLDASRVPTRLVALADGTVAELDDVGASFRRPPLRTPFSNPPATLLASDLALGSPGEWRDEGAALVARRDGARASIATLRFASFRLMATVVGEVDLLLGGEGAAPISVRARPGELGPAFCTLSRDDGEPVELERAGSRLTLRTAREERTCVVEGLDRDIALGFRATEGARLSRIELTRVE